MSNDKSFIGSRSVTGTEKYDYVAKKLPCINKRAVKDIVEALEEEEQKDINAEKEEKLQTKNGQGFQVIDENHPMAKNTRNRFKRLRKPEDVLLKLTEN